LRLREHRGVRLFGGREFYLALPQPSTFQNAATEATVAFEQVFGAGLAAGFVHPIARFAFLAALEQHFTEAEGLADQRVQIDAFEDDVAAEGGRR